MLQLAEAADPGFDRSMFAQAIGALAQVTDTAFADYGTRPDQIAPLRQRFVQWRDELISG
ncbi:hypothetical protein [Micromonospora sp. CA-111912]|uniref:hypothetical protein n=1 Tax=Micromonospora sp. CA-111912 TaxID=3239955 RepID=UPI003D8D1992